MRSRCSGLNRPRRGKMIELKDFSELTLENVEGLLAAVIHHLQARNLRIGVTLVLIDRGGIKTVGNMTPGMQGEALGLVVERLAGSGPDSETDLGIDPILNKSH